MQLGQCLPHSNCLVNIRYLGASLDSWGLEAVPRPCEMKLWKDWNKICPRKAMYLSLDSAITSCVTLGSTSLSITFFICKMGGQVAVKTNRIMHVKCL